MARQAWSEPLWIAKWLAAAIALVALWMGTLAAGRAVASENAAFDASAGDERAPVVAVRPGEGGDGGPAVIAAGRGEERRPCRAGRRGQAADEGPAVSPASRSDRPVTPEEKIKFEQDKANAHMRELESRMFHLAEMLRPSQPDDSARLLMGVSRSREQLIVEEMREASELIATLDLNKATVEEKELIAKLEELKRLLLTNDLDLEIKLEQLRKLREAQNALARLTARERQQLSQTNPLAKNAKNDSKVLSGLKGNERRNQRSGEDLQQVVKRLGPPAAPAVGALGGACNSMGGACSGLG